MTTKAEAVQLAAEFMRIVPVGQALQSQHDARIQDSYDWTYSKLQNRGLAVWSDTGAMPTEVTPHFVALMSLRASEYEGVSPEVYQKILLKAGANGEVAESEIRSLIRPSYESIDLPNDF